MSRVGFLFQNPDEQLFAQTVAEEVAFGPSHLGKKPEVKRYLGIAGLKAHSRCHPQTLSRGQRQILAVVSVMAMEPEILILDERQQVWTAEAGMNSFPPLRLCQQEGDCYLFNP